MVVFEYVLWIASQVLFLLLQVVLLWNIWTQGAFAGQGERVRRAVFLAWGGLLVLLALVMSFNLTLIWPRIPIDMAEGGQLAWAANLAGARRVLWREVARRVAVHLREDSLAVSMGFPTPSRRMGSLLSQDAFE
jgi:hypothetical protein